MTAGRRRRRRARGGRRSRALLRDARPRGRRSPAATREQARAIARDGPQPALPRATCRPLAASRPRRIDEAPVADAELVVVAVPSRAFARRRRGAPGRGAGAQPDEGARPRAPASGSRRSSRGRPVAVLSGPEHGRGGRRRPARRRPSSRARTRRSRCELQDAINSTDLPRLRQRRPRRRRAVRRGEERDRARRRRRRRPRARRQREGGADHARARRDGAARRGVPAPSRRRSPASPGMGDLIVTCWHPSGPQPPRRRADRARRDARGGRAPRSARWSRG